jgi:hypothetical protein
VIRERGLGGEGTSIPQKYYSHIPQVGYSLVVRAEGNRGLTGPVGHNTHVLMSTYAHVLAHRKAEVITTISELVLGGEPGSGAEDLRTTPTGGIESSSEL